MDFVAIQQATDEDLGSLGLLKRGDILALRSCIDQKTAHPQLCEERAQKKKKLLQLAKEIKTSRQKNRQGKCESNMASESCGNEKQKSCTRKIQVGWLHYDLLKKRYMSVHYCKGGGSREIPVNLSAGTRKIINAAKDLFFPNGKSFYGDTIDMTFELGKFNCTVIGNKTFALEST